MRWQESHYYLHGREIVQGFLVYDKDSPLGPHDELLYVENETQLNALRQEYARRTEEERAKREAREAELIAKHEARLRELVELFKSYCKENESYFPFDLSSQIDYIICRLLVEEKKANRRLDDVLFEIKDKLFTIPYPQRAQVIEELKRDAVYIPNPDEFKPSYVFPTIKVIYKRDGEIIGKERGLGRVFGRRTRWGGKIALFKCSPPKDFTPYVLAVRFIEKPNVILVYEYVKFDLQELLAKREYLKALEKKILEKRT
jgi:hypothetical protein